MDYRDTPEEAEFRKELRAWLAANAPRDWQEIIDPERRHELYKEWAGTLYEAGYRGLSWPVEYGGQGRSPVYEAILNEEAGNAGAPPISSVGHLGRAIYTYGTDEQKRQHLPSLLSGQVSWCQGFSEPDAGSDLANLKTRAVLDGDRYVVNGQKMWTSGAQFADWCLLLARTDPESEKHRGITCLLTPMTVPGITVRPIILANGDPETCEVFWDDVEIPATGRLGAEGEGWRLAMTTVSYERGPADIGIIANFRKGMAEIEALAAERGVRDDPEFRKEFARCYALGEGLRLNVVEQLSMRVSGRVPGPEGSVSKILWAEAEQALQHLGMAVAGPGALLDAYPERLHAYFRSRPVSVYGGSVQIQRNILSRYQLGLPR